MAAGWQAAPGVPAWPSPSRLQAAGEGRRGSWGPPRRISHAAAPERSPCMGPKAAAEARTQAIPRELTSQANPRPLPRPLHPGPGSNPLSWKAGAARQSPRERMGERSRTRREVGGSKRGARIAPTQGGSARTWLAAWRSTTQAPACAGNQDQSPPWGGVGGGSAQIPSPPLPTRPLAGAAEGQDGGKAEPKGGSEGSPSSPTVVAGSSQPSPP